MSSTPAAAAAAAHANIVQHFLDNQVQQGYIIGLLPPPTSCTNIITSSLAVIPKKAPNKWRVIVDLSSPTGASTNDNLQRRLTHVAYSSVEAATILMHALGPGSLLAKIDIRDAYRIVPVHPQDRPFLGVKWRDQVYVDCQLPFGPASAPAIFSAIAEALEWILRSRGIPAVLHYLDDFLLLGPPRSQACQEALDITLATCSELGIPIAEDKVEGPPQVITFLGVELNSAALCVQGAKTIADHNAFN